jgi:hypothetical protein
MPKYTIKVEYYLAVEAPTAEKAVRLAHATLDQDKGNCNPETTAYQDCKECEGSGCGKIGACRKCDGYGYHEAEG